MPTGTVATIESFERSYGGHRIVTSSSEVGNRTGWLNATEVVGIDVTTFDTALFERLMTDTYNAFSLGTTARDPVELIAIAYGLPSDRECAAHDIGRKIDH